MLRLAAVLLAAVLLACGGTPPEAVEPSPAGAAGGDEGCAGDPTPFPTAAVTPRFAERFRTEVSGDTKRLTVEVPEVGATLGYVLFRCGTPRPPGVEAVEVPVGRVVTTSTTELPHLESLGLVDRLVGHDDLDYVSSSAIRRRIADGLVTEVGPETRLNLEILLALDPDLVLWTSPLVAPGAGGLTGGERRTFDELRSAGIAVVQVPSYLETSPLGRAEWILFTAAFFNREAEAKELFDDVARRYLELARLGRAVRERPSVFTGGPIGDVWYVPGGRSFMARLVEDAGGSYLWADDTSTGSLPLAVESVYERARDADVWLHPSSWTSRAQVARADERLTTLAAFASGRVYANDARLNVAAEVGDEQGSGGNDYWETGTARPDLVLADLLAILHPELLPEHRLVFHRRLGDD